MTRQPRIPGQTRDLFGQKFGRLTAVDSKAVERMSSGKLRRRYIWSCACDCGAYVEVESSNLTGGRVQSCGCLRNDRVRDSRKTENSEFQYLYAIWRNMIDRCYNQKNKQFSDYGGRGITVCDAWRESLAAFARDVGQRPQGATIGRKDNDGPYSPGNCQWETYRQQARNTRRTVWLEINGVRKSLPDWCDQFGIDQAVVRKRIRRGWAIDESLFRSVGDEKKA